MKSFFDKTDFTLDDVQSLIDNGAEESLYLEFKASGAIGPDDSKKIEISKDVSAFANADGGIIIYGLLANKQGQASEITYIDCSKFSKDWLQQVIEGGIQRHVSDLIIYPLANPLNSAEQIYIVKVLASAHIPHMAKDGKFHRRNNKGNVAMEEYEVRRLYSVRTKTDLEVVDVECSEITKEHRHNHGGHQLHALSGSFKLQIKNVGNLPELYYKVELHIPLNYLHTDDFRPFLQRVENGLEIYSFGNTVPIFPNEINTLKEIPIVFHGQNIHTMSKKCLVLKLYYSSDHKTKEIAFKDLFTRGGREISSNVFD